MPDKNMIISAVVGVALLVLFAAGLSAAIQYWPITLAIIAGIIALYVLVGKAKERKNRV